MRLLVATSLVVALLSGCASPETNSLPEDTSSEVAVTETATANAADSETDSETDPPSVAPSEKEDPEDAGANTDTPENTPTPLEADELAAATPNASNFPTVTVYKSPTCGCCAKWIDHLREEGFTVETNDVQDMRSIKKERGVPASLSSCHTGEVGGYVVEGHVPADDIKALLAQAPDAIGIAVPGMPIGSPGMEVAGQPAERYDVVMFREDGMAAVFAQH